MFNFNLIDLKKEIDSLTKIKYKDRGSNIKHLVNFIKTKYGEEGFKKVKNELLKNGYKLPDIDKIDEMEWIPSHLPILFLIASAKVFNLREKDIIEIGRSSVVIQSTMKIFIRYFMSAEKTLKTAAKNWQKHVSQGQAKFSKFDKKNKTAILHITDLIIHPLACLFQIGVFTKVTEIATGSKNVKIIENKCMCLGDPYHEFIFNW